MHEACSLPAHPSLAVSPACLQGPSPESLGALPPALASSLDRMAVQPQGLECVGSRALLFRLTAAAPVLALLCSFALN